MAFAVVACFGFSIQATGAVWYVDVDNNGTEDGTSWATAFSTIQEGVNAASADYTANGGSPEVWVAAGTYTDVTDPVVSMAVNVQLYGGFDGAETSRSERDWTANRTIIDGEDTRRGVKGANDATLDGFSVTRGYGPFGGGMYNIGASPTVINCAFFDNSAAGPGGAMHNDYVSVTVIDCTFSGNSAGGSGGGINTIGRPSTVTNCTFFENSAEWGGGMSNSSSQIAVTDCIFSGNSATKGGGGLYLTSSSGSTVANSTFSGNSAAVSAGTYNSQSDTTYTGCIFQGNVSYTSAGAMTNSLSSPTLTNCIFFGNSAQHWGGVMYNLHDSHPTLVNCTFSNNMASYSGDVTYNHATYYGPSSTTMTNCIVWGNGPVWTDGRYDSVVTHSIVQGGYSGTGNLDLDPLFRDSANGNLRIAYNSPAIDSVAAADAPSTDIVGLMRPVDIPGVGAEGAEAVDMGAYEMPRVVHVDANNTGTQDGLAWATAFNTVQEGINAAALGEPVEVWVAKGRYNETATLKSGVWVYGGFFGDETLASDRDAHTNLTMIDATGLATSAVTMNGTASAALDGFAITGGNTVWGGGISASSADATNRIANCIIVGNTATYGGGLVLFNSSLAITNCLISGNTAISGGGLLLSVSSPSVTNCGISGNSATDGGGLWVLSSSAAIVNCTLSENAASKKGGAVYLASEALPLIVNTLFYRNTGHAVYEGETTSNPKVTNCAFESNPDGDYYDDDSRSTLTGAAAINALAEATGTVDGDPEFVAGAGGTWTAVASHDSTANTTTLTDSSASFEPDALAGRLINADTTQRFQALIVANTANEITVAGDLSSIAAVAESYALIDYHLRTGSAAVDAGTSTGAPLTDFEGDARDDGAVDIGIDELTGAEVWVDFAWEGVETGTLAEPYSTLQAALNAVAPDGVIHLNGASAVVTTGWTGEIGKPMRIEAGGGPVAIGQ